MHMKLKNWLIELKKNSYTYIFPTITFSKSDWKYNLKRFWIVWLNYQICIYKNGK